MARIIGAKGVKILNVQFSDTPVYASLSMPHFPRINGAEGCQGQNFQSVSDSWGHKIWVLPPRPLHCLWDDLPALKQGGGRWGVALPGKRVRRMP